jgi:hypothetical protein
MCDGDGPPHQGGHEGDCAGATLGEERVGVESLNAREALDAVEPLAQGDGLGRARVFGEHGLAQLATEVGHAAGELDP